MPLLGHDTYPAIIASRIQNFSDFIGTFTEVLMDGRLWAGEFYRPMGNLLLAFDYALWGTHPNGYQITSMGVWCAAIVVLYRLCRSWLGGHAWIGPSFAAIVFALHPAVLSVLPYPGRRTETLMLLFVALALLALPQARAQKGSPKGRLQFWTAGLMTLLAVASKETGVIAIALVFLHQFLLGRGGRLKDRLFYACRASLPSGMAAAVVLTGRFFVIGGIGGYHEQAGDKADFLSKILLYTPDYLSAVFVSGSLFSPDRAGVATGVSLCLIVGLGLRCVYVNRGRIEEPADTLDRVPTALVLGGVWLVMAIGLACSSLNFSPRYILPMTFATGLILGALAEGIVLVFRRKKGMQRTEPILAGAALVAIMLVVLGGSAIGTDYPELQIAARSHTQLLDAFDERFANSSASEQIHAALPDRIPVKSRAVDDFWVIAPWGLQAWLELEYPDRKYEVRLTQWPPGMAKSGYWPVALIPIQPTLN
jgi:4-amino-4-deoxy-L-arabinose transferase-like glycosyltransferase